MENIDLSLVLALYNEGPTLVESLEILEKILEESNLSFEIILVDDKSKDNTAELAENFISHKNNYLFLTHEKNIGRGGTVSDGIMKARGQVVGFVDVDLENSPEKIPEAARYILSGQADIVTGRRIYKFQLRSVTRYFASKGYHLIIKYFLSLPLKDTETGFKFFNQEKILPILKKVKDKHWFWDTEIMTLSYYHHLKIKEIPVIFKRCLDKKSTVRIFKDSWDYFVKLVAFKFRKKQS